jgi:hypothetical protein
MRAGRGVQGLGRVSGLGDGAVVGVWVGRWCLSVAGARSVSASVFVFLWGWVGWGLGLLRLRWGRRVALRCLSQCRGSRDMDAMGFWRLVDV